MRFVDAVARLERLPDPLPDLPEALRPFAVLDGRPEPLEPGGGTREAAVLVLLYPGADGEAWTVLTERPAGDLRHAGEVSFPGGAVEPEDASMAEAAIREAREEVGLDPAQCGGSACSASSGPWMSAFPGSGSIPWSPHPNADLSWRATRARSRRSSRCR